MRRWIAISMGLLLFGVTLVPAGRAQETAVDGRRKVVSQVVPDYPPLARTMNLEGTVKLLVTVSPNGTAKSVEIIGGHPVLAKAAETSVYKFRWAPAQQESREPVEMRFSRK
jgi:TonB family protein